MTVRNILIFVLVAMPCLSADIHFPTDDSTVKAAIDAATDGDSVLIAAGTLSGEGNRDVNFKGKAITVVAVNGPDNCIIRGNSGYQIRDAFENWENIKL